VMYLNVPTETQPDYWIRRGTALLSMTNDWAVSLKLSASI
jgi:hypothetical protein